MNILSSSEFNTALDRVLVRVPSLRPLTGSSVLVTGSTGLIGSAIVALLVRAAELSCPGLTVYAAGRSLDRLEDLYGDQIKAGLVKAVQYHAEDGIRGDIAADYIIHAASNAHPAAFAKDPVGTIDANVNGLKRLLEHARSVEAKRTVYVSSGEVYGEVSGPSLVFDEDLAGKGFVSLRSPRSAYPEAKRMSEVLCVSAAAQFGQDIVVVRPSHTYGPNQTSSDSRAHAAFLHSAATGRDIVLKSAGAQVRSYTFVADAASGIVTCMVAGESGEAYNIANPLATCSIAEFAAMCAKSGGVSVLREGSDSSLPGSPISRQVLNASKLESLGWSGCYGCEEGIALSIRALRQFA